MSHNKRLFQVGAKPIEVDFLSIEVSFSPISQRIAHNVRPIKAQFSRFVALEDGESLWCVRNDLFYWLIDPRIRRPSCPSISRRWQHKWGAFRANQWPYGAVVDVTLVDSRRNSSLLRWLWHDCSARRCCTFVKNFGHSVRCGDRTRRPCTLYYMILGLQCSQWRYLETILLIACENGKTDFGRADTAVMLPEGRAKYDIFDGRYRLLCSKHLWNTYYQWPK